VAGGPERDFRLKVGRLKVERCRGNDLWGLR
jgi:hypothetical protein